MTDAAAIATALEPLFGPADVPNRHRVKAKVSGGPAEIIKGRRPTPIAIAQNLRQEVDEWRAAEYGGASETSRELLFHWFRQDHEVVASEGRAQPFAYYFCQREAVETLIYLYEVRGSANALGLNRRVRRHRRRTSCPRSQPRRRPLGSVRVQDRDRRRKDEGDESRNRLELLPLAAGTRLDASS